MRSLLALLLLPLGAPALADAPKVVAPKLTTVTTPLYPNKACKTKAEGGEGQDPVLSCPGIGGYTVTVFFSAEGTYAQIEKGDTSVQLGGLSVGSLEWRVSDGKPIAVLAEVTVRDENDKKVKRYLVRGLAKAGSSEIAATEKKAHDKAIAAADALASP